jgi:Cd2+/Zn2+-exporting ATPase
MASPSTLKLRIEGMDCGACAVKIENAMKRLPGVSDINVSYGQESLSLTLDEDRTSPESIETKIKALGFTPLSNAQRKASADADERNAPTWWRTRKGRFVLFTGAMFAIAFALAQIDPRVGQWAYSVAALVSIAPVLKRVYAGAISGTPFSIETLMSVAALGAVAIGAAQEAAVVIFLFAVGELLETIAAGGARSAIESLMNLTPREALRDRDGKLEKVSAEDLLVGDIVIVRPGDRVPSDGRVIDGISQVDEAPITGESVPVPKEAGARVFAGSINANGELRV